MKQPTEQIKFQQTEELNLIQILQFIWSTKLWVFAGIAIALALTYLLVVLKPLKPNTYQVTQSVEIATLQAKTQFGATRPFPVERSQDITSILPNLVDPNVQYSVPGKSDIIITFSATNPNKDQALAQVASAVSALEQRHQKMIQAMQHTSIINPTAALKTPIVIYQPYKANLPKYLVYATVLGGFFGLLLALIIRVIRNANLK